MEPMTKTVQQIAASITYDDLIFQAMIDMKNDEVLVIAEKVHPNNRKKFIEAVKRFIDSGYGINSGYCIEFNQDYSKVRKFNVLRGC